MSTKNNKTKNEKNQYHHLNRDQRAQIEILINETDENGKKKYSNADIANKLGVHRTTIWRELKSRIKSKIIIRNGKIKNIPYNVNDAQYDADYKRAFSKTNYIVEQYLNQLNLLKGKSKMVNGLQMLSLDILKHMNYIYMKALLQYLQQLSIEQFIIIF